MRQALTQNKT